VGVTFRTRSRAEVRAIRERLEADLRPALDAGKLRLPIDSVLPFEELPAALERMRSNQHFGKIVLAVGG
jgi:NADPH2:quinone reductase